MASNSLTGELQKTLATREYDVRVLEECQSTMEEAWIRGSRLEKPVFVMSLLQKQGRGRQGKSWLSPQGGFYGTFCFTTSKEIAALIGLSLAVGVWIAECMASLGLELRLKWPNDICTKKGEKVAGILIETKPFQHGFHVLIGVGINLKTFPEELPLTSSLHQQGLEIQLDQLAQTLLPKLYKGWCEFSESGFIGFRKRWTELALYLQQEVEIQDGSEVLFGKFQGVDNQGVLLLERGGALTKISSLVSLRPAKS